MGFPLVSYCVAVPKPVVAVLKLLDRIRFAVLLLLFYLGVYRPSSAPTFHRDIDFYLSAGSGDLPPVVTPSSIKARLPVVTFASLAAKSAAEGCRCREETICACCLENLEISDEVRELGGCRHAFHKACIDHWVDVGQITCPLCRSQLLPPKGMEDWGTLLKILARLCRNVVRSVFHNNPRQANYELDPRDLIYF